jgi:16S rRNA G966 N2-methylase RsmD
MEKEQILKKFGNKEYSVTEDTFIMGIHWVLADYIARRFIGCNTVLDVCCGAGFTSIALAKYINQVVAVEVKPNYMALAETNTQVAGVRSRIKFIPGDILEKETLNKIPKIDAAFLDPDWAKVGNSKRVHVSKFSEMDPPADELFNKINKLTPNIALRLPKEIDLEELKKLPPHELEPISLKGELKFYCTYFGKLKK